MFQIYRHQLERLCPRPQSGQRMAIWDEYARALERIGPQLERAGITDDLVGCHMMAQWAMETGGFTLLWESGNYSADRIVAVFGKGRHSAAIGRDEAEAIAALPTSGDVRAKELFERTYGLGNPRKAHEFGNTEPGDGWIYRGFGGQQITGKTDHQRLLGGIYTAESSLKASIREWTEKGCTAHAKADDCYAVTKLINGGTNGLAKRQLMLSQAKDIWLEGHGRTDDDDVAVMEPLPDALVPDAPKPHQITAQRVKTSGIGLKAVGSGIVASVAASGPDVSATSSDATVSSVIDAASDMVNQVDTMASIVARVSALASHIGDGLLHVISSPMAHVGIMIIAAGAIVWLIGHRSILLHDAAHAEPTPKIEEKD